MRKIDRETASHTIRYNNLQSQRKYAFKMKLTHRLSLNGILDTSTTESIIHSVVLLKVFHKSLARMQAHVKSVFPENRSLTLDIIHTLRYIVPFVSSNPHFYLCHIVNPIVFCFGITPTHDVFHSKDHTAETFGDHKLLSTAHTKMHKFFRK